MGRSGVAARAHGPPFVQSPWFSLIRSHTSTPTRGGCVTSAVTAGWAQKPCTEFVPISYKHPMLRQDVQYAIRSLWNSKAFATVAILCLGFGIGLNTTIFSIIDGVLLKPY